MLVLFFAAAGTEHHVFAITGILGPIFMAEFAFEVDQGAGFESDRINTDNLQVIKAPPGIDLEQPLAVAGPADLTTIV